jgi:hypothetical protein
MSNTINKEIIAEHKTGSYIERLVKVTETRFIEQEDTLTNNSFNLHFLHFLVDRLEIVTDDMTLEPRLYNDSFSLDATNNLFTFSDNLISITGKMTEYICMAFPEKSEEIMKNTINFSKNDSYLELKKELDSPVKLIWSYYNIEMDNGINPPQLRYVC